MTMSNVNWVLAGIGDIARKRVIPAIQAEPRSQLYGFVTRDPAKAAAYPGARTWATWKKPSLIPRSTPFTSRCRGPACRCRDRGPARGQARAVREAHGDELCAGGADGRRRPRGARSGLASGRLFGVSYYRRLYPKLLRAKHLIAEGAIGRPLLAEANCHGWLEIEGREWLPDPALAGGGPLYDIASHRIDAMNFLFGKPERACGLLSNAVHRMGVEDSATVLMQFPGGVHGVVDVRWNSRVARDQFRIIGEDGEINLDPLNGPELRVTDRVEALPAARQLPLSHRRELCRCRCWPTIQRAWRAPRSRPVGPTG